MGSMHRAENCRFVALGIQTDVEGVGVAAVWKGGHFGVVFGQLLFADYKDKLLITIASILRKLEYSFGLIFLKSKSPNIISFPTYNHIDVLRQ